MAHFGGSRHGEIHRPAALKARPQGGSMQSSATTPCGESQILAREFNSHGLSRVLVLLGHRRPAHVAGLVVPVAIKALQCVESGRPEPNVFKEEREVVPSLADANAAATVVLEPGLSGRATACAHVKPGAVCVVTTQSVFCEGCSRALAMKAAAGQRHSSHQGRVEHRALRPAHTATEPLRVAAGGHSMKHCPASKCGSRRHATHSGHGSTTLRIAVV